MKPPRAGPRCCASDAVTEDRAVTKPTHASLITLLQLQKHIATKRVVCVGSLDEVHQLVCTKHLPQQGQIGLQLGRAERSARGRDAKWWLKAKEPGLNEQYKQDGDEKRGMMSRCTCASVSSAAIWCNNRSLLTAVRVLRQPGTVSKASYADPRLLANCVLSSTLRPPCGMHSRQRETK